MEEVSLSVVMPVFNEADHLADTVAALAAAVDASGFDAELIVVDDGSSDASAAVARGAAGERIRTRVVSQPNRGRFEARRAGLDVARGRFVLLLDGRVRIARDALAYVRNATGDGREVWTAHVDVADEGNPYGVFWRLIAELAWPDYFADPRDVTFGSGEFDRYPKGTTCFFAPHALLAEAIAAFDSRYADLRQANDDTPLLRWIAERVPISVSPRFRCTYTPRQTLRSFFRHAFHRGIVFVDGHGRRESRFFPAFVSFYPASAVLAVAALRRPAVAPATLVATSIAVGALGIARGRPPREVASLVLLSPVYGVAHGLGMWSGLLTIVAGR